MKKKKFVIISSILAPLLATAGFLSWWLPSTLNHNKSYGLSNKKQLTIDEEVARINELSSYSISKTSDIEKDSLKDSDLNYDPNKSRFLYKITNAKIENDGDFRVNIEVSRNGISKRATRKIKVVGINQAKKDLIEVVNEVHRINDLARHAINKNDDVKRDSLTQEELDFASSKSKFTYQINHDPINKDHNFYVNIKVSLNSVSRNATRKIQISGIDKAKQAKQIQANVDEEVARINALAKHEITKNSIIAPNSLTDLELEYEPDKNKFDYEITHSQVDADGDFAVTIKVSKNGISKEAQRHIIISGIDQFNNIQAEVDLEVDRINDLPRHSLAASADIAPNSLTDSQIDYNPDKSEYEYSITHILINQDGEFDIIIKVKKGAVSKEAKRKVDVSGIDAIHQLQTDINAEIDRINKLQKHIYVATAPSDIPPNSLTKQELNFVSISDFAYEIIHSKITGDGDVAITIRVTKGGISKDASFQIQVTDLSRLKKDKKDQEDLTKEVARITALLRENITNKDDDVPENDLNLAELKINPQTGFTYDDIAHPEIDHDDNYLVKIRVTKNDFSKIASRKIQISGIDQAKRFRQAQAEIANEVARINSLLRIPVTKDSVADNSLTHADLSYFPNNSKFTYEIIHDGLDQNGDLDVTIRVTQNGFIQEAKRKVDVSGIDEKAVRDEVRRISTLPSKTIIKTNNINANDLKYQELDFNPNNSKFTYEIIHDGLDQNGDLDVTIRVTKNDAEGNATRKIHIDFKTPEELFLEALEEINYDNQKPIESFLTELAREPQIIEIIKEKYLDSTLPEQDKKDNLKAAIEKMILDHLKVLIRTDFNADVNKLQVQLQDIFKNVKYRFMLVFVKEPDNGGGMLGQGSFEMNLGRYGEVRVGFSYPFDSDDYDDREDGTVEEILDF